LSANAVRTQVERILPGASAAGTRFDNRFDERRILEVSTAPDGVFEITDLSLFLALQVV
jgi:hypothetical protein